MARKAAKTGPGPMVTVALEQGFPKERRIIDDNLAYKFLPFGIRMNIAIKRRLMSLEKMVAWTEKRMPGMWGGFLCRKRYMDEKILEEVGAEITGVMNLGAGFDTRAYRIAALSGVSVWEVDQPVNIEAKKRRIIAVLGDVPKHITLVSMDFDVQALERILPQYGYVREKRTFFIWEGVTQYLPEASIRKTLEFLAQAAGGSRLVFTYICRDFIAGKNLRGQAYLYEEMVRKNKSWLFGMEPGEVPDLLGGYGWHVLEDRGYGELAERYVLPTGRKLHSTSIERVVYAEKK